MRSKLFVPGARPELFAKALAGEADALSFDLEDSVVEARKAEARETVARFVASDDVTHADKLIIVRTNAPDSAHFAEDITAVALPNVTLINLPKIESPEALLRAIAMIENAEHANGVKQPIGLLVNIETPLALAHAAQIAGAHPRVAGLQLGLGDLFEPHGIDRTDARHVHASMFALRMAAAQANVFAMDGAFATLDNDEGYAVEARMARGLGFVGKSCIHPRQVSLANAVFAATDDELEAARRIVDAANAPGRSSNGAFVVDGKMIDLPFLKRAQVLLAASRKSN
ncbi:CoA ester lyase [Rhodanobacter sp. L36]|uniref:HpcH/HpaI aldolase/citrate lyase family protein n=1 Tax=Rhodanobacter sp. L36 TaxID=1747221 RepID=UPI00131D7275|nr:CoA ester lyase [Rhodanobacter sp. L36]